MNSKLVADNFIEPVSFSNAKTKAQNRKQRNTFQK